MLTSTKTAELVLSSKRDELVQQHDVKSKKILGDKTLQFEACKRGDLVAVRALVNEENVNDRDEIGDERRSTCLHFAAGYGRRDICEYLIDECHADPCLKDTG
jgi:hypothetical protein